LRFRQFLTPAKDEPVIIVDDVLRTGARLQELKQLLESFQAQVLALAVVIYQPNPETTSFGSLPFYYLAKLDARYYVNGEKCDQCRRGIATVKVWM
jgi:orotate phosphoribosyltransferase